MKKYFGFLLAMLLLLEGCVSSNIEDPSILETEGFKKYTKTDIYIEDSLISQPVSKKKYTDPEIRSGRSGNYQSGPDGAQKAKPGFEWVAGPDRDTTWDEARSWVQSLTVDGGGWRMPTMEELKTLYQKGDIIVLANATGSWVWSSETKGSLARLFSFRYGIDKWTNRGYAEKNRGFAVRPGK
ncbi:MAG: DUF1566 domain-containing protein [Desulfobacterales bacterium]|uniref:DUF1566 domain-containing protein n=1 Tax=Candidatus Desulfatibia vada TaxID=2841696 RepID=A0A8J6P6S6_9BACT|nr:DUF1566 domain-containing protein [Candidatus Desulfatibia vada]MBL6971935.1 DUF1566 domain-containing protein [Desulfobacterales bacterium]